MSARRPPQRVVQAPPGLRIPDHIRVIEVHAKTQDPSASVVDVDHGAVLLDLFDHTHMSE
jgi:hypothetical protein